MDAQWKLPASSTIDFPFQLTLFFLFFPRVYPLRIYYIKMKLCRRRCLAFPVHLPLPLPLSLPVPLSFLPFVWFMAARRDMAVT